MPEPRGLGAGELPNRITVAWDRGPSGDDALALGALLARGIESELRVVHVSEAADGAAPGLERELARVATEMPMPCRVDHVAASSPARGLQALGNEPEVGILVLGSTHRAGIGRVLPGSVVSHVIGRVACPIAVAPRGFAGRTEARERLRVLAAGFDGSPTSEAALALGAAIAAATSATIRVIAVGQALAPDRGAAAAVGGATPATGPDLQDRLHAAVGELPSALRALPIYERGVPVSRLLALAEEGVDMMLVGSRGHGRISAALLGSTAAAVLESAPCPVIVVAAPPS